MNSTMIPNLPRAVVVLLFLVYQEQSKEERQVRPFLGLESQVVIALNWQFIDSTSGDSQIEKTVCYQRRKLWLVNGHDYEKMVVMG